MERREAAAGEASVPGGLEQALADLFPHFVVGAVGPVGDQDRALVHAEECAAVAAAAPVRREQFLAGRACAHAALRSLGRDGPAVGRGPTRAPVWPPFVVGSIAHTAHVAGAVVARAEDAWGLGLDIEPLDPPLDLDVERLVCTPAERAADGPARHRLAASTSKLIFCAKECVYKAVAPATGWPLDFQDVRVQVDLVHGRYRAVVDERFRVGGLPLSPLHGRVAVVGGVVLAGLWVGRLRD